MRTLAIVALACICFTLFGVLASIEYAHEMQCRVITSRSGMLWRYTWLDGCQVQAPNGIWRPATAIDIEGALS